MHMITKAISMPLGIETHRHQADIEHHFEAHLSFSTRGGEESWGEHPFGGDIAWFKPTLQGRPCMQIQRTCRTWQRTAALSFPPAYDW